MKAIIEPGMARGRISAPPSKSCAHRLLICAALAAGESRIDGAAMSQDILATMDCVQALGAEIPGRKRQPVRKRLRRTVGGKGFPAGAFLPGKRKYAALYDPARAVRRRRYFSRRGAADGPGRKRL